MTKEEAAVWGSLSVTVTGLAGALTALRKNDVASCDRVQYAVEAGKMFSDRLEELMSASNSEKT